MKLRKEPCPCGCANFMVVPLIGCQCGTLDGETADELIRRWNSFEKDEGEPLTVPRSNQGAEYNARAFREIAGWVERGTLEVRSCLTELLPDESIVVVELHSTQRRRLIG